MKTFDALALGYAGAVVAAACMLLLSILGSFGLYTGAVAMMAEWHMFYDLSVVGTITGMIEAAIVSFIGLYVFALVYNWFVTKK